jgi:hypothetical protein
MALPLKISSPKRTRTSKQQWDAFFPYYAGFSEKFADEIIASSNIAPGSCIHDPWNGSGTTTFAASMQGIGSIGFDLNPAMVVVSKARHLAASEADSLLPLGQKIATRANRLISPLSADDPLSHWFGNGNASVIRAIETSIREHLLGPRTAGGTNSNLDHLSSIASTHYVALFSVCRDLVTRFRSTNPTWLRLPRPGEHKPRIATDALLQRYCSKLADMSNALHKRADLFRTDIANTEIRVADSTEIQLQRDSVDLVLTSPPYCTRIDYTAATRVELAVLQPVLSLDIQELGRRMIGSTRVPLSDLAPCRDWGGTCASFLDSVRSHKSKASSGYYYKTHLDYFDKISRSVANFSQSLKFGGRAILVVQDSYYKELHNDLPQVISEICDKNGLALRQRQDFHIQRTMANFHPYSRAYKNKAGATEAVLCFQKT